MTNDAVYDILDEPRPSRSEADELAELMRELKEPSARSGHIKLKLNPYQSSFMLAPDRGYGECLYSGSVGSGKSLTLCLAMCRYLSIPNTSVMLTRYTLQDLKRSTLQTLLKPEPQLDGTVRPPLIPASAIASYNKVDGIIRMHNGSQIITIGAQEPEKVRSVNVAAAFLEEGTELTDEEQYEAINQRCRVPCELPNIVMTATNPKTTRHFLYRRFFQDRARNRLALTVSAYSNPYLSKAYIRKLEALPETERKKMLLGEWVSPEAAVFSNFNASAHVKPCAELIGNRNLIVEFVLAQDYGGGSGGSAMVLLGKDGAGTVYCLTEFYKTGPSHSQVLEWMERYRDLVYSRVVYDSANAALKIDMENRGWTCIPSIKDVEGSVASVNSWFHDGKLVIDPGCQTLIRQLEDAGRDPATGMIVKVRDWDAVDAFRYGVVAMTRGDGAAPVRKQLPFTGIVLRSKV